MQERTVYGFAKELKKIFGRIFLNLFYLKLGKLYLRMNFRGYRSFRIILGNLVFGFNIFLRLLVKHLRISRLQVTSFISINPLSNLPVIKLFPGTGSMNIPSQKL